MAHNKKRNTAFLFEILLREGTKNILNKDIKKANFIKNIITEFFNNNCEIKKELELYKALEAENIDKQYADRYLQEVKIRYDKLDKKKIFNEQSSLIRTINRTIGSKIYNTFVPNYKNLATISQIFNNSTNIREKVLLENTILEKITLKEEQQKDSKVDNVVFNAFAKKFNEKYNDLLTEQKNLLNRFVGSFNDDGLELKIFLNEEIQRLKESISAAKSIEEIKTDVSIRQKVDGVEDFLKNFKDAKEITHDMLEKILKIQQFVHEVNK